VLGLTEVQLLAQGRRVRFGLRFEYGEHELVLFAADARQAVSDGFRREFEGGSRQSNL